MKQAIFVSPHLDDAIFSAGALILKLQELGYECTVLNVCSEAGTLPQTLSAKAYLSQVGFETAEELYLTRRAEDTQALSAMGVKPVMMGKIEALWRKKSNPSKLVQALGRLLPEFLHVYPTYKFHIASGKIAPDDKAWVPTLTLELQKYCPSEAFVFCPLGIGGHIDHLIVRDACEGLKNPVIYWSDIPYVVRPNRVESSVDTSKLKKFVVEDKDLLAKKEDFCKMYATQYAPVFEELKPSEIAETYYYDQSQTQLFD